VHNLIKIQGSPGLMRDIETRAIINNNSTDYQKHLLSKQIIKSKEDRIEALETDMSEIKQMLRELLEK
jgi:hypothetical protein